MLLQPLAPGPVDIVGDVHGELTILDSLLATLGYDARGAHPQGRRLVFVGDLTDRGPDSPGVVRRVRGLIEADRAQCVLGNHELNILRGLEREGNGWFYGESETHDSGAPTGERLADEATRSEVLELFRALPLALERDDLRVVHAAWHDPAVDRIRAAPSTPVLDWSAAEGKRVSRELGVQDTVPSPPPFDVMDRSTVPPMLTEYASRGVQWQNLHPVKVATSGLECVADEPFWAGGRWRFERREPWWRSYDGPMVVFGHYWRSLAADEFLGKVHNLFADTPPRALLGTAQRAMCVDYSIGKRSWERATGAALTSALAAFRMPERELVTVRE